MEIITKTGQDTSRLGESLGPDFKDCRLIALWGDLGSGKTTFVQGLAKSLGIKKRITSPTFLIAKPYILSEDKYFWHVDLYRISKTNLDELGLSEVLANPNNLTVIEWPEIIEDQLPKKRIDIYFKKLKGNGRKIKIDKRY